MDLLMNNFIDLLKEETDLYKYLLSILAKERDAVVDSDLAALSEAGKEKETLLLKIRILEEQRIKMLERLVNSIGCTSKKLTLTELSQLIEEPYSTRLKDCNANLLALTQSIREANNSNRTLLGHSLELVRGSLNLLDNLIFNNAIYYQTGKMQNSYQSGMYYSGMI